MPRLSAKSLPSARNPTLGKDPFAVGGFAEWRLLSVTLGKEFTECKLAFAECNRYSAKPVNPVVRAKEVGAQRAHGHDAGRRHDRRGDHVFDPRRGVGVNCQLSLLALLDRKKLLGFLQPFPPSNSPQTHYLLYFTTALQKIPPPITSSLQPFPQYLFPLYTITH